MRPGGVDHEATLAGTVGHRHPERLEQRVVLLRRAAAGREVVPDDERVRAGEQAHALQLAEHVLATTGEAEPGAREDEPEQRDGLERFTGRDQPLLAERGAAREQEVDRHLARVELGELEREVDALIEGLAHAEDAAAAQLHARVDREPRGRDPVVVGVRRADRREHLARRLEVVVVPPDTRPPRAARPAPGSSRPSEHATSSPVAAWTAFDGLDHLVEQALRRPPHRNDDAELGRAGCAGRLRASTTSSTSR